MAFGLNSSNPRERRAYVHALRDKALATNNPLDRVEAISAAAAIGDLKKGRDLGRQTLQAFFKRSHQKLCPEPYKFGATAVYFDFVAPPYAIAMQAVAKIEAERSGVVVSVSKLGSYEGYVEAARVQDEQDVINASVLPSRFPTPKTDEEIASIAQHNYDRGNVFVEVETTQDTSNFQRLVGSIIEEPIYRAAREAEQLYWDKVTY